MGRITSELIAEAKEKLGDQNEEIMVELLHLNDYDTRGRKCCCPFHHEDTPSFKYNPKNYSFKCFGCGISVDIIDILMRQGKTFSEAAKWLLDKAEIDADIDVASKNRGAYHYPKYISANDAAVYDYLRKRGISSDTAEYLDITADGRGNMCFNYYDTDGKLVLVKERPAHTVDKKSGQSKTWCQAGADTSNVLFNMNRVRQEGTLLICEGEIDCASFIEAGFFQTVSVPFGAGNTKWIDECWDFLQCFDTIIIAGDNDEPGKKMISECCRRLNFTNTKYIDYPEKFIRRDQQDNIVSYTNTKDANEILQTFGAAQLLSLVNNAKETPIESVARMSEIEELDVRDLQGIKTGIKPLDKELMKLFTGGVTVLTGKASAGKTTFLNATVLESLDAGFPVFLFSRELLNSFSLNWLTNVAAGRRHMHKVELDNGDEFWVVNSDAKKAIANYYNKNLYVYKDSQSNDKESLLQAMRLLARRRGVKTFIIDNLMTISLDCNADGVNKAQTDLINDFIKFAMEYDVAVILVAHPRKTQSGQELDMFDVAGTSNIVNLATRTISLRRITDKEKENENFKFRNYDVVITILKDRIFGSTKDIPCHYDKVSRRFCSDYAEFDKQYKWDTNVYTDKLDYPFTDNPSPFE